MEKACKHKETDCNEETGCRKILKIYIVNNDDDDNDVYRHINLILNWPDRFKGGFKQQNIIKFSAPYNIIETHLSRSGYPHFFLTFAGYKYVKVPIHHNKDHEVFTLFVRQPLKGQPHKVLSLKEWSLISIYKSDNEQLLLNEIPKQIFRRNSEVSFANYGYPIYDLKLTAFEHFW